jgi:thiosulfate sulfurtransferase
VVTIFARAVREAIMILIVVVAVSLLVNYTRERRIDLIADAEEFRVQTQAEFMVPEDAYIHFNEGTAIFVDVRDARLFAAEHIEGAMNVTSGEEAVDSLAGLVPADPVLICYSTTSTQRQAGVVADKLIDVGFTKVYVLLGGLEAWKELGGPVSKGI